MQFKTVLAIVGATDADADIGKAIELAAEQEAHLSIIVAGLALPPSAGDFPSTVWLDQRYEDLKILDDTKRKAETACAASGLSFDVDELYTEAGILSGEIFRRALYADLVFIAGGVRGDRELTRAVLDGSVFDARRPLLVAPEKGNASLRPQRVLLAWNSRVEAARAAREALDVLVSAGTVNIVIVDPDSSYWENGGEPGADVAVHLARHGVNVVVEQLASGGRPIEDVLQRHALESGCDMIVMGAYGHSRLRERIFGGVTASILKDCAVPVFLAR
ncbi:universal stress protein [Rhizobium terrae]|uniref:universal stress protein n=1 Tax=Rhizobium terrae TaxID=2171756 RepID=UPI000E3B6DDE|nr:universal stress protein [Rhizobium terrae]